MLYMYVRKLESPVKVFYCWGFFMPFGAVKGGQSHENNQYGILAHVDAGKTTLTEACYMPAEPGTGSVEKGTTRTDTMFLERQRGITIQAAVTSFQWHRCKVNIVDTPGHMDFWRRCTALWLFLDGPSW